MQLTLQRRVSQDASVAPDDVRSLKKTLNRLGYYQPDVAFGITRIADRAMIDGLRDFQREHGLPENGVVFPDGPTLDALNAALTAPSEETMQ